MPDRRRRRRRELRQVFELRCNRPATAPVSVNPSQSSSVQFSIVDSPNRSSSSVRLRGTRGVAARFAEPFWLGS